ncbi:ead/Ea22-like family protein [Citrobacter sp. Res13-Sevr-PEB04-36]|uniref:ead/Ea22-like family protein n=1 Tax=Citrobacter sp. Res13-Sevr-PEB04-36 TaxID=2777960 RepID=UPI0018ACC5AD|nr:ead/Ea22-like family protein [Citrobacter sp. Res13-Sevr-PEB04-36]
MTALNKQALREAANAANIASFGKWEAYKPHKGARGYEVKVGVNAVAQHCLKVHAAFIAAANPQAVLALLDELEAAQHEKDELQQGFIANQEEAHEAIKYATEMKEQLARACAGREEAFREVDEMQKSLDHTHRRRAIWRGRAEEAEAKLEAAEKRIGFLKGRMAQLANFNPDWDALEAATESLHEHISELSTARSRIAELEAREVTLPPLNDDLIAILGRPNFTCSHLAELMRKSGDEIRRKSEHEQAAVIHWFLGIYLEHGDKWEGVAKADIQSRVAAAGIGVKGD